MVGGCRGLDELVAARLSCEEPEIELSLWTLHRVFDEKNPVTSLTHYCIPHQQAPLATLATDFFAEFLPPAPPVIAAAVGLSTRAAPDPVVADTTDNTPGPASVVTARTLAPYPSEDPLEPTEVPCESPREPEPEVHPVVALETDTQPDSSEAAVSQAYARKVAELSLTLHAREEVDPPVVGSLPRCLTLVNSSDRNCSRLRAILPGCKTIARRWRAA